MPGGFGDAFSWSARYGDLRTTYNQYSEVDLHLQLGCNYTGFFERAADMFEQISAALPQYHDYVQVCRARNLPNERLAKSLSVVYADIIDFCHQMYMMLSGRRTGMSLK